MESPSSSFQVEPLEELAISRRDLSPAFRRNFSLGVLNGAFFVLAYGFISLSLVLPGLIRRLGGSNVLVGLLPVLDQGGWFLPQLLVGAKIQDRPCKLPIYWFASVFRGVCFALLLLVVAMAARMSPGIVLTAFFLLFGLNALGSGVAGIPFQDVVAKAIPPDRRGSFFGLRQIGGGLLVLLIASPVVATVLAEDSGWVFPHNYTLLFGLALGGTILGLLAFSLIRELPSRELGQMGSLAAQLRLLPGIWRSQPNLRRFLAYRVLSRWGLIAEPFYVVYVTEGLGAPPEVIGGYLAAVNIVQMGSFLVWGWLSDRRGNRLLLRLGSGLSMAAPLLALVLPLLGRALNLSPLAHAYLFALVFALSGLGNSGVGLGGFNYLLEIIPERDRSAGLGMANTITGLAGLLVILGGGVADLSGYRPLFYLAAGLALGGFLFSLVLPEPRGR